MFAHAAAILIMPILFRQVKANICPPLMLLDVHGNANDLDKAINYVL